MRYALFVVGYVIIATSSMILFKMGAGRSTLTYAKGAFSGNIDSRAVIGVALYLISFLLWLGLLASRPLTFIVPVTTALLHISIAGAAIFILGERVGWVQYTGIGLIVVGVLLVGLKAP